MDNLTPTQRSTQMALVRSKDTKPEMKVRKIAHGMGYRYGLHRKNLPGKPDLVFATRKKVIFVNGCFWHGHKCPLGRIPKSRVEFWTNKIENNKSRDKKNMNRLTSQGWSSLILWECRLKNQVVLKRHLKKFLEP